MREVEQRLLRIARNYRQLQSEGQPAQNWGVIWERVGRVAGMSTELI